MALEIVILDGVDIVANAFNAVASFVKNATDGFMIIDAMDLLYTNRFDAFCLVSSDSDFTALAIRLKEQGSIVYGFGKKNTPEAFRNACTRFIYVENLNSKDESLKIKKNQCVKDDCSKLPLDKLHKNFEQNDWINLGMLGQKWGLLETDFDPRNYGCKKLSDLIKKYNDIFELKISGKRNFLVRLKKLISYCKDWYV